MIVFLTTLWCMSQSSSDFADLGCDDAANVYDEEYFDAADLGCDAANVYDEEYLFGDGEERSFYSLRDTPPAHQCWEIEQNKHHQKRRL